MDRKLLKLPLHKTGMSNFICPSCGKGRLKIMTESFNYEETNSSKIEHSHEAWDPEWITYIFSCQLGCLNKKCKDIVACAGKGSVSEEYGYDSDGNPELYFDDYFMPEYFTPHLRLFQLPKGVPDEIAKEINKSFSLFFVDPGSAANHIRISLEHLLTYLRIKRFSTKNGKRHYLALHKRIDLLPKKYDHIRELFFAIKWLGNAGSHSTKIVSIDDVLDSYELMEELLTKVFNDKSKKIASLAKTINKKKGPK